MGRRVRKTELEEELMTPANIARVIKLLEPEDGKPITKKEACQILGMAYNTTRLSSIIQDFKDKKTKDSERRAALRGKPVTLEDASYMISEYLDGATIDSISASTYRSPQMIKRTLEQYAVPIRASSHDYFSPQLIPAGAMKERFKVGEVAYSARYDSKVIIEKEYVDKLNLGYIYRVWLTSDKWKQYAYTEAFELASLEHLVERGIRV